MIKNLLVISGSANKVAGADIWGYGPYINELNLWLQHTETATLIAPYDAAARSPIDVKIVGNVTFVPVPEVSVKSLKAVFHALFYSPYILWVLFKHAKKATLIHVRAPSNMGLLGSIVQIFFPKKKKIAKYAANFDPNSNQPFFNTLQRSILINTFLTRNMQLLVYGNWPGATKNCYPFFTATYRNTDIVTTPPRLLSKEHPVCLLFVGTLRNNKKPLLSIQVCEQLRAAGLGATLDLYGDGPEREQLENYISDNALQSVVCLHGNQSKETVKLAFQKAHFLIFISKSEGWPKVVAEGMFWGCLPITTAVSMVPEMIGNQERGALIAPKVDSVVATLMALIDNPADYATRAQRAMDWSRQYTVDKFEASIATLIASCD
jgi:glycosyltransferase involved in cell wall biosynthesis